MLIVRMQVFYILGVLGAAIFINGFFPINYIVEKNVNNEPPKEINNITLNHNVNYVSKINKTVIILIDALRLDLSSKEYLPLTSKIMNENGCFCDVNAEIPTVTLPRIKSLTTGTIPQFIDIVLNLANPQVLTDSIIHSAKKQQKNIVFYGDETWLKLFPGQFLRYEGTNSFFVRDFKEVDDNVTRNLDLELHKDDWDILILHYLGLDHIGHVYGPFSPLVPIKLKEMDEIIFKVHQTLSSKQENILLVVTSDHGMRDNGGHGGSTYGEIKVPLFLIGLNCKNTSLQQFDIPANLAVLLGLNIPSTVIGRVDSDLVEYTLEKKLYILRYNLLLLKQKSVSCDEDFETASKLHMNYLVTDKKDNALKAIEIYRNCSEKISLNLMKSSVQQNHLSLAIGIIILLHVLFFLVLSICIADFKINKLGVFFLTVPLLYFFPYDFILILLYLIIQFLYNILVSIRSRYNLRNKIIFVLFLQPLTFLSSSFVEEEHQVWYFVYSVIIVGQTIYHLHHQNMKFFIYSILILGSYRFIRRINATGDQWANYPDLSDWFSKPDNYLYNLIFIIISLTALYISVQYISDIKKTCSYNLLIILCIFIFKITDSIQLGQACWLLILFYFLLFHQHNKILSWIFIIALLLKPCNLVMIPFCIFCHLLMMTLIKRTELLVLSEICLGNMLYFAQGHSNSLASIDVSVGYTGLYTYQPIIVIFQVLLHTYSFPVLCHSLLLKSKQNEDVHVWNILFCYRFYTFFVVSIITFLFRHHLFIWSVFAPKLFIEFIHVLFLFLECGCYFLMKRIGYCFYNNKYIY